MKRLLASLLLSCLPFVAYADANDWVIQSRNSDDSADIFSYTQPASQSSLLLYNYSTKLPAWVSIGTGLNLSGGVLTGFSGAYSSLSGIPSTFSPSAHTQAFSTITSTPTTLSGYGIVDAYPLTGNPSGFVGPAGARSAISLTTTGSSGAATYNSATGVLNVPNYAPGTGTVTSVTAGAGLSGGTITTSGTISLPNTGASGTYNTVTTDAQGRVTGGSIRSFSSPARALNTAYQISATQDAAVTYSVDISVTSLLLAGASGRVTLEYADNVGMSTNVVTVSSMPNATGGVLNVTNLGGGVVSGWIPAGKYARIRTTNVTGTPVYTYQSGQEVLQ